jgi:hypothetical protein
MFSIEERINAKPKNGFFQKCLGLSPVLSEGLRFIALWRSMGDVGHQLFTCILECPVVYNFNHNY